MPKNTKKGRGHPTKPGKKLSLPTINLSCLWKEMNSLRKKRENYCSHYTKNYCVSPEKSYRLHSKQYDAEGQFWAESCYQRYADCCNRG